MRGARYPWDLLPELSRDIEFGRKAKAHADLDRILQLIAETSGKDLGLRKLRCAEVLNMCLRGARSGGVSTDRLLEDHLKSLRALIELRAWGQMRRRMHTSIRYWERRLQPVHRSHMECLVVQIRHEMHTLAGIKRSLGQYAVAGGVSKAHLSRSFTRIIGRSFREELARARLEITCRLLEETSLKIAAVAAEVGLRDPSKFIAFFHSQTGSTPATYRQMRLCRRRHITD